MGAQWKQAGHEYKEVRGVVIDEKRLSIGQFLKGSRRS